jgi:hypothetical protein
MTNMDQTGEAGPQAPPVEPPSGGGKDRGKLFKVIGILVLLVAAAVLTVILAPWLWLRDLLSQANRELIAVGVPPKLAFGLVALGSIPFVLAFMRMFGKRAPFLDKLWPPSKLAAFIMVMSYVGSFSILTWYLSTKVAFAVPTAPGEKGFVQQYYCPSDFSVFAKAGSCPDHDKPLLKVVKYYCPVEFEYFEGSGVCPEHGKDLFIVTPVVAWVKSQKEKGVDVTPRMVELAADGPFYNTGNGFPVVFFGRGLDSRLRPFNFPGVDGSTGAPLREPTPGLIGSWYSQRRAELDSLRAQAEREQALAEQREAAARAARRSGAAAGTGAGPRAPEPPCDIGGMLGRVAMEPDNAALHAQLARCYEREGDRAGAIREYREMLRIDPTSSLALTALRRLGVTP